jgi:ABC-type sulfate transport system permease subunit
MYIFSPNIVKAVKGRLPPFSLLIATIRIALNQSLGICTSFCLQKLDFIDIKQFSMSGTGRPLWVITSH